MAIRMKPGVIKGVFGFSLRKWADANAFYGLQKASRLDQRSGDHLLRILIAILNVVLSVDLWFSLVY